MKRLLLLLSLALLLAAPALAAPQAAATKGPAVAQASAPLNVNLATVQQLETLPGIGPAIAERIVSYRDEHGPFKSIDALGKVKGIGPATLEKIRPLTTVQ